MGYESICNLRIFSGRSIAFASVVAIVQYPPTLLRKRIRPLNFLKRDLVLSMEEVNIDPPGRQTSLLVLDVQKFFAVESIEPNHNFPIS